MFLLQRGQEGTILDPAPQIGVLLNRLVWLEIDGSHWIRFAIHLPGKSLLPFA